MKTLVIYNSQTGFTKKYAEWICEESGADGVEFKKATKLDLSAYDKIVFGGWFMAGGITKLAWFKKKMPELTAAGKKLYVFAVGASPAQSPDVPLAIERNFSEQERKMAKVFYCPGGLDYSRMNFFSKCAMKMLVKSMLSKKDATEEEIKRAKEISSSYDISDKKYVMPLISELKA